MKTLAVRIPDETRRALSALSERTGKPMSALVREAIDKAVAIERFRILRARILPFAEAEGLLTDEDVFSVLS